MIISILLIFIMLPHFSTSLYCSNLLFSCFCIVSFNCFVGDTGSRYCSSHLSAEKKKCVSYLERIICLHLQVTNKSFLGSKHIISAGLVLESPSLSPVFYEVFCGTVISYLQINRKKGLKH